MMNLAMNRRIWQAGKAISNHSILAEVRDRETFVNQKKTKKERQKAEQVVVQKAKNLCLLGVNEY